MSGIPVPAPLKLGVDDEEAVKVFKLQWNYYALATGVDDKPDNQQVATLMAVMGVEGVMLVEELGLTAQEKSQTATILKKIEEHLVLKRDKRVERAEFNTICQRDDEKIEDFVKRLKKKVASCGYSEEQREEHLKDRIIAGIHDHQVRKELLRAGNISLANMLKKMKEYQQIENLARMYEQMSNPKSSGETSREAYKVTKTTKLGNPCRYCGGKHKKEKEKCPAYGKKCLGCGKMNHFKRVCRSKQFRKTLSRRNVRQLEESETSLDDYDSEEQCEFVDIAMVDSERNMDSDKIMVQLKVVGKYNRIRLLDIQVDTGAKVNVLSYEDLN